MKKRKLTHDGSLRLNQYPCKSVSVPPFIQFINNNKNNINSSGRTNNNNDDDITYDL